MGGGDDLCGLLGTDYCIDNSSPIVIDVTGNGYQLTDLDHGVVFNLSGHGTTKISWTDPGKGNAWLVLDRNRNGLIDDGRELFGSFTPQPWIPDVPPNGFRALAVYDQPEFGGNHNGYIDQDDTIYTRLRLWIDANQNGISEPQELRTLQSFGIVAIDLQYNDSRFADSYGNRFRYRGDMKVRIRGDFIDRVIWDVLLLHTPLVISSLVRPGTAVSTPLFPLQTLFGWSAFSQPRNS